MVESRPIDRHQSESHQAQRGPTRLQATDRHLEADPGARIVASNRRWEQSYCGERTDSHRWLRFR